MSNFSSDSLAVRLLDALAQECRVMAEDIAWLGGRVSGGTADIVDLQSFDFLVQHAQAQAMLMAHLARMQDGSQAPENIAALIDAIPLPRVRARLLCALRAEAPAFVHDDGAVLWMDV